MRIEFRDVDRQRIGRAEVDLAERPTRVTTADTGREIFLNWDGAVDDAGQLRTCISCGCRDLFQEKVFPQVTGIVVVLAFAGAFAGMLGLVTNIPVLTVMVIVLLADIAILLFARKRLICYRCGSRYRDLAIAGYHRRWDRATAERYPAPQQSTPSELEDALPQTVSTTSSRAPVPRPTRPARKSATLPAVPGR